MSIKFTLGEARAAASVIFLDVVLVFPVCSAKVSVLFLAAVMVISHLGSFPERSSIPQNMVLPTTFIIFAKFHLYHVVKLSL